MALGEPSGEEHAEQEAEADELGTMNVKMDKSPFSIVLMFSTLPLELLPGPALALLPATAAELCAARL